MHSRHRSLAVERAGFTGENHAAAALGATRAGDLGLDSTSLAQRQLRALLALAVLNCGPHAAWLTESCLYELSLYTFLVSPRQEELVVISGAAENIANRLLPGEHKWEGLCLPGMRLLDDPDDAFRLFHLPTGARLTTTCRPDGRQGGQAYPAFSWWCADKPITPSEKAVLVSLPSMTQDAEILLGSLVSRLWFRDPHGGWAIGGWFNLPSQTRRTRSQGHSRRLDGSGDRWTLEWTSYPYPEDLVAALTHPRVGLQGVRVYPDGESAQLVYGTARLTLVPERQPQHNYLKGTSRIWC